jgi:hypothetical protein
MRLLQRSNELGADFGHLRHFGCRSEQPKNLRKIGMWRECSPRTPTIPRFAYGSTATQLWLREYMNARMEYIQREGVPAHDFLPAHIRANIRTIDTIDANNIYFTNDSTVSGELEIEHFRFTITYGRMNDFVDLMQLQQARRAVVARYERDGRTKDELTDRGGHQRSFSTRLNDIWAKIWFDASQGMRNMKYTVTTSMTDWPTPMRPCTCTFVGHILAQVAEIRLL